MGTGLYDYDELEKVRKMITGRKKAAVVACSNAVDLRQKDRIDALLAYLRSIGITPVCSECLYQNNGTVFAGSVQERAGELMRCYRDPDIGMILDVSGGDVANGILPYLDFDVIKNAEKVFWGYSDLTTIINAIYSRSDCPSVLYQARNLCAGDGEVQRDRFRRFLQEKDPGFFEFSYEFLRGRSMEGVVTGGNIRCLLKLAGTGFWPDMRGCILLLEAAGGSSPQMAAYLAQLGMMGVFRGLSGILLGTFLSMEETGSLPEIAALVKEYAGDKVPVARTQEIGHRENSHAILIGTRIRMKA